MDYTALYFNASENLGGEDDAGSGIFRLFGSWTLTGRETGNTGSAVFKVENRHAYTNIPVSGLGFETGYAGLLGPPFNDNGWMLTNLYWQQKTRQGRLNFVAGWVDATDYIDLYGLINPWTAFSNFVFITGSATMPVPDQGLGGALGAALTDNLYVVAGLTDANGSPTDPGDGLTASSRTTSTSCTPSSGGRPPTRSAT